MRTAPYYESRFVRANNPDRPQALWLRSTLLLPKGGTPVADVWVMVFDPDGSGNRALKQPYSLNAADFRTAPWAARIAETTVDDGCARGSVAGSRSTRWDLRITPGGEQPVKLLTDRGYTARFPSAKTMVRSPLARFDGGLEIDGIRVDVDGWTGSINHNWGRHHTPAYAFGQVCGFDGEPDSSLEIVTARAGVGPVLLPPITLLVLRYAGTELAVRSPLAARHTHGSYRPFTWSFSARVDGVVLDGTFEAQPADVIGLTYANTNGVAKYCYNSAIATCRVRLSGQGIEATELTARRRAMLEILRDKPIEQVPLLV